jgi:hypothetical protein
LDGPKITMRCPIAIKSQFGKELFIFEPWQNGTV